MSEDKKSKPGAAAFEATVPPELSAHTVASILHLYDAQLHSNVLFPHEQHLTTLVLGAIEKALDDYVASTIKLDVQGRVWQCRVDVSKYDAEVVQRVMKSLSGKHRYGVRVEKDEVTGILWLEVARPL